jgi:hypothetical protein
VAAEGRQLVQPLVAGPGPVITFRDGLRARLRQARPGGGVRLASEAAAMIASYLALERDLGRIAADADVDILAPMLLGAVHLLFADRDGAPPEPETIARAVRTVIPVVAEDRRSASDQV